MTTQELEIALQALAAQNVQLLERAERAEKKWAFVHEQYMAEREKRMAYEANANDNKVNNSLVIIPRKSRLGFEALIEQLKEHHKDAKLIEWKSDFEPTVTKLKPEHPEPKGELSKLPDQAIIPQFGYQLGSTDILNKDTDYVFDALECKWVKVDASHGSLVLNCIAYRDYSNMPELPKDLYIPHNEYIIPKTAIIDSSTDTVLEEKKKGYARFGRTDHLHGYTVGERIVKRSYKPLPNMPAHPAPNGEVPPLPEGVTIPDNAYQLGLDDVLNSKTDRFWGEICKRYFLIDVSHGLKVDKLASKIAYRIYK